MSSSPFSPDYKSQLAAEKPRKKARATINRKPAGFDRTPIHLGQTPDHVRAKQGAILKASTL